MHKALTAAGIAPSYLLVGDSLGGGNAQVYAYRYPAQVKGLVLVEPHTENETARPGKVTAGKIKLEYSMVEQQDAYCLGEAEQGFKPGTDALNNCVGNPMHSMGGTGQGGPDDHSEAILLAHAR